MSLPDLSGLRILFVDDAVQMRQIVAMILKKLGCTEFQAADSVANAETSLRLERFDCILLDYSMGEAKGPDLLRKLRADPKAINRDAPVIMLTGHAEAHIINDAVEAGANAYLVKPVLPDALGARILDVVKKAQHTGAAPSEVSWKAG